MKYQSSKVNRILIVDDIPANLGILTNFLDDAGFEVLVAPDGESALKRLKYVIPDLILLDVMMPGIDGFETYQRIKENPLHQDIPVMFITALCDTNYIIQGFALGAVDYITKPFQKEEVLARIKTHLEIRHFSQTLAIKNQHLLQEIQEHTQARKALQKLTKELEIEVEKRTAEISHALEDLHRSQAQLEYNAFHDPLTGLPNRAWLMKRLEKLINEQVNYAVLFIDLDQFKLVNDSLGHLAGDELLKCVAHRLQGCLNPPNTMTRMGGDEFVVLVETTSPLEIADHLLDQFKLPFKFNHYEIIIEASIGITLSEMGYQNPMDILRDADIAMDQVKKHGSRKYEIFDPQMQAVAIMRLQLEQDIRKAIAQQKFCLHYQPIFSLATGEIKGFEALVRWYHSQKGIISPLQFISIAEETGLINPLGHWVLEQACHQLRQWQAQFPDHPLQMNVNVSPVQMQQINWRSQVAQVLRETNIPKNCLNLEIIETCLLNVDISVLNSVKELGVRLCLDDFGTGYSSLSILQNLPIDIIKVDRDFVKKISDLPNHTALIQTILWLGNNLNMEVVAEGIETEEQLKLLQSIGYTWGQGYWFSRPLDASTATEFIASHTTQKTKQTNSL